MRSTRKTGCPEGEFARLELPRKASHILLCDTALEKYGTLTSNAP